MKAQSEEKDDESDEETGAAGGEEAALDSGGLLRTGTAAMVGPAYQADVPAWPFGDLPTAGAAAARAAAARGEERVKHSLLDEEVARCKRARTNGLLRLERERFNVGVLGREPRRRWPDEGALRVSLGYSHAQRLLAYVRDPTNRDARGSLQLDGSDGVVGGYGNYRDTHAAESGKAHSQRQQLASTLLLRRSAGLKAD